MCLCARVLDFIRQLMVEQTDTKRTKPIWKSGKSGKFFRFRRVVNLFLSSFSSLHNISFVGVSRSERAFRRINVCLRSCTCTQNKPNEKEKTKIERENPGTTASCWKRNIFTLRSLANKWIFYSNFVNFR